MNTLNFKPRVLLVEDTKIIELIALGQLRRQAAVRVDVARTGQEALALLKQASYALIMMDVEMPEMDGITATRIIRKEMKSLPIIGVTSLEETTACLDAGMDEVVSKPANYTEIVSRWLPFIRPRIRA